MAKKGKASITESAASLLGEVEKTAESLAGDVKQLFDSLTEKMAGLAGTAAETTVEVAQKVSKQPEQILLRLVALRPAAVDGVAGQRNGFDSFNTHKVTWEIKLPELEFSRLERPAYSLDLRKTRKI